MTDLISKGELFNALCNASEKAEIFSIIQDMPTKQTFCGFDLDDLARAVGIFAAAGVKPEEIKTFIHDTERIVNLVVEDMQKSITNAYKSAIDGNGNTAKSSFIIPSAGEVLNKLEEDNE